MARNSRYVCRRGVEKEVDDSRRREAELKEDVGDARFMMAPCEIRAAEITMDENGRGGNRNVSV